MKIEIGSKKGWTGILSHMLSDGTKTQWVIDWDQITCNRKDYNSGDLIYEWMIEGQRRFSKAVSDLIDYYSKEFNLTYAECVGILIMVANDLSHESRDCDDEEEEENNGKHIKEED